MAFHAPSNAKWLPSDNCQLRDPEPIAIRDISIDTMTEPYATLQMSAQIEPIHQVSLRYKVVTGASGNVMPLYDFAKLFPKHINTDGKPLGLHPSNTHLKAYNASTIP